MMKLYAFSDFHLSGDPPSKPMDIFGEKWHGYVDKIKAGFAPLGENDVTVLCGDLSWGMSLEEAKKDFAFLDALPGARKLLLKGNHDYWWDTVTKMTRMTDGMLEFLHNSAIRTGQVALAGTRGWISETSPKLTETDKPIIAREEGRLERSLDLAEKTGASRIMAVLHYPPFDEARNPSHMIEIMKAHHVPDCIYGHIHGAANFTNLPEELCGIKLHLTSADYLDFKPHFICNLEESHA